MNLRCRVFRSVENIQRIIVLNIGPVHFFKDHRCVVSITVSPVKHIILLDVHEINCRFKCPTALTIRINDTEKLLNINEFKRPLRKGIDTVIAHIYLELCQVGISPCAECIIVPAPFQEALYNIRKNLRIFKFLHVQMYNLLGHEVHLFIYLRMNILIKGINYILVFIQLYRSDLHYFKRDIRILGQWRALIPFKIKYYIIFHNPHLA